MVLRGRINFGNSSHQSHSLTLRNFCLYFEKLKQKEKENITTGGILGIIVGSVPNFNMWNRGFPMSTNEQFLGMSKVSENATQC